MSGAAKGLTRQELVRRGAVVVAAGERPAVGAEPQREHPAGVAGHPRPRLQPAGADRPDPDQPVGVAGGQARAGGVEGDRAHVRAVGVRRLGEHRPGQVEHSHAIPGLQKLPSQN